MGLTGASAAGTNDAPMLVVAAKRLGDPDPTNAFFLELDGLSGQERVVVTFPNSVRGSHLVFATE